MSKKSNKIIKIHKHKHPCDIGTQPNLYKSTKRINKKPKMPKDKDLFVFKGKKPLINKNYLKKKSYNNIYNGNNKTKHRNGKTKYKTQFSKSVFAKYHKITHSAKADARKRLRTFTTVSSRRNRLH